VTDRKKNAGRKEQCLFSELEKNADIFRLVEFKNTV